MKHILPLLMLALLGAAATASAANFFDDYASSNGYSYYAGAQVGDVVTHDTGEIWGGEKAVSKSQIIDYGNYQVVKTNDVTAEGANSLQYNSHYRIRVKKDNVDFYLFDFVDSVDEDPATNPNVNALSNAANVGISQIGYRILDTGTNLKRAGEEYTRSLDTIEEDPVPEVIDHETSGWDYDVTRNKYYLGTFNAGEEFEIYMSYSEDAESGVWSYSTEGFFGGYYGGENAQPYTNVDTLMAAYKAQTFDFKYGENVVEAEVAKAMPFATLSPSLNSTPKQVVFGIQAVGSPLPGGLPIALVAALFGLGFWYNRRRKAVAA